MEQVSIDDFPRDIQAAVRRAQSSPPAFGPGLRICISHARTGRFAEAELRNFQQLSVLALELVRLGYVLSERREDDCDFVLERDSGFAEL